MSLADFQFDSQQLMPWNETGYSWTSVKTAGNETSVLSQCAFYPGRIAAAAPSNGIYVQSDSTVTFSFEEVEDDPKPRDLLVTPDSRSLVCIAVQESALMMHWSCVVRDLVLAYDLRDSATIKRSTPSPDAAGYRERNVSTVYSNVPCRLQPMNRSTEFGDDRVNEVTQYTCYLGQALTLDAGDTIEVSSVLYEVIDQSDIDEFDTLTTVTCERRR